MGQKGLCPSTDSAAGTSTESPVISRQSPSRSISSPVANGACGFPWLSFSSGQAGGLAVSITWKGLWKSIKQNQGTVLRSLKWEALIGSCC